MLIRERLIKFLLKYGETGVKQSLMTNRLQRVAAAPELLEELEAMRREKKVQRFTVPTGNARPITYWRATTEIVKE